MAEFEFTTRVSYDDVDQNMELTLRGAMGMMQEAAIVHSDLVGYSVRDIPETRVIWMLVRWRIRLVGIARWNELVTVRTWPRTMERATSERDFEIVDKNGQTVALGVSLWTLVSADTGRIIRIPSHVAEAYDLTDRKALDGLPTVFEYDEGTLTYCGNVQKRDIDSNHHVNNRVYLDYAIEALSDENVAKLPEIRIHYRKQMLLGQKVQCLYHQGENGRAVSICGENAADVRATVEFCQ